MTATSSAVCGIYGDRQSIENAIDMLRASGFRDADICAMFPDQMGTKKFIRKKQTKLLRGVAFGSGIGALTCGAVGWSAESVSLLTASPLIAILLGLGAGSALGSFIGGLAGMRILKSEEHYESRVRRGDVLLAVHCDSPAWEKKATEILKRTRATDVSAQSDFALNLVKPTRAVVAPSVEKTVAPPIRSLGEPTGEVRKSAA